MKCHRQWNANQIRQANPISLLLCSVLIFRLYFDCLALAVCHIFDISVSLLRFHYIALNAREMGWNYFQSVNICLYNRTGIRLFNRHPNDERVLGWKKINKLKISLYTHYHISLQAHVPKKKSFDSPHSTLDHFSLAIFLSIFVYLSLAFGKHTRTHS